MHIGLIIYGSLDSLTGGWIYDRLLVAHLRERGWKVEVIALKQRAYLQNLADNVSPRLYRRLLRLDCRLLLEDELVHPSLFSLNRRIRRKRGFPVIAIVHQVLCKQPLNRYLQLFYQHFERRYVRSVDGFIFNSDTTRRNVGSLTKHPRPSIVACPGGDRLGSLTSMANIEAKCRRSGPLKLVVVGNLTPNKGIVPMIEGLARLPQQSWRLEIVGSLSMDRGYARRVNALIARLGLCGQIDVRGPLEGDELVRCLARSHVFVLPFSCEAFGMACLEAMAWGLPVVGSSAGALREFVADGINGLLIPPGDIAGFAEHIHRLHTRRGRLADLSKAALETFRRRPTWNDSLVKIHAFLTSLADRCDPQIRL